MMTSKKSFIPRDRPKSWILAVGSGLIGVMLAGPIGISGKILGFQFLTLASTFLFFLCWFTMSAFFIVGLFCKFSGRWDNIKEKDWKDQVW